MVSSNFFLIILLFILFLITLSKSTIVFDSFWHIPLVIKDRGIIKCIVSDQIACLWHDNKYNEHTFINYYSKDKGNCTLNVYDWLKFIDKTSGVVACSMTGTYQGHKYALIIRVLIFLENESNKNLRHCNSKNILFNDYYNKLSDSVPHICLSNDEYVGISELSSQLFSNVYILHLQYLMPVQIILPKFEFVENVKVQWNDEEITKMGLIRHYNDYWIVVDVVRMRSNAVQIGVLNVIYEGSLGYSGLSIVLHFYQDFSNISGKFGYRLNLTNFRVGRTISTIFQYKPFPIHNSTTGLIHMVKDNQTRGNEDIYLLNIECTSSHCSHNIHHSNAIYGINNTINKSSNVEKSATKRISNDHMVSTTDSSQTLHMLHISRLIYLSFTGSVILIIICLLITFINCIKKRGILCYANKKESGNTIVWMSNEKYGMRDSLLPEFDHKSFSPEENNNNNHNSRYSEQITQCTVLSSEDGSRCIPSYSTLEFEQSSNNYNKNCFPLFCGDISELNVKLKFCIGSGAFGKVFLGDIVCINKEKCKVQYSIAAKEIMHSEDTTSTLFNEMSLMKRIGYHANIVTLIGYCKRENLTDLLIMEFCSKGSLKSYLNNLYGKNQFPLAIFQRFSQEIALGMEYLSSKNIIHRDLAARNVLLSERYVCKISDFGMSRQLPVNESYYRHVHGVVPLKWMAPEVLVQHKYSTQADVWSYGILLWEIFSVGTNPYENFPMNQVTDLVNHGYRMPIPYRCPEKIAKLVGNCWNFEPNLRPTFKDIVRDLW